MKRRRCARWITIEEAVERLRLPADDDPIEWIQAQRIRRRIRGGITFVSVDDLDRSAERPDPDPPEGVTPEEVDLLHDPRAGMDTARTGARPSPGKRAPGRRKKARQPQGTEADVARALDGVRNEIRGLSRELDSLRSEVRETTTGEVETVHAEIVPPVEAGAGNPAVRDQDRIVADPPRTTLTAPRLPRGRIARLLIGLAVIVFSALTGFVILSLI